MPPRGQDRVAIVLADTPNWEVLETYETLKMEQHEASAIVMLAIPAGTPPVARDRIRQVLGAFADSEAQKVA